MKELYITEKQQNKLFLINEGISDKLYHFTDVSKVKRILKYNILSLTSAISGADATYVKKHNLFYLCCQRSKNCKIGYGYSKAGKEIVRQGEGRFNKTITESVRIELDGYQLKADGYNGRPVDYWAPEKQKQIGYDNFLKQLPSISQMPTPNEVLDYQKNNQYFEMEDRIETDEPFIKNASKYIKRIDILDVKGMSFTYSDLIHMGEKIGIPVFVYKNINDYNMQNNKYINRKFKFDSDEEDEVDAIHYINSIGNYLSAYITLYVNYFKLLKQTEKKQKAEEIIDKFNLNKFITPQIFSDIIYHSTNKLLDVEISLRNGGNFFKFLTREYFMTYSASKKVTFDDISNVLKFINYVFKLYKVKNLDELFRKYA